MRNFFSFLIVFCIALSSCKDRPTAIVTQSPFIDTSTTFRKEIPVYLDGPNKGDTSSLFEYIREDASQLGLDYIENGYDELQIRIWLGHSMAVNRHVVVLRFNNRKWSAQVVYINEKQLTTDTTAYTVINNKEVKNVTPQSGWEDFIHHLYDLNIFEILNEQDIYQEDGCGGADGMIYYYELATPQKYRFFHHCYPKGNLLIFASYLEKEFGFEYTK